MKFAQEERQLEAAKILEFLIKSEIRRTMFVNRATTSLATGWKEMFYEMVADPTRVDSEARTDLESLVVSPEGSASRPA